MELAPRGVGGHGELGLAVTAEGVELVQAEVLARGCTDGSLSDRARRLRAVVSRPRSEIPPDQHLYGAFEGYDVTLVPTLPHAATKWCCG